jgi:hypothetical protein
MGASAVLPDLQMPQQQPDGLLLIFLVDRPGC